MAFLPAALATLAPLAIQAAKKAGSAYAPQLIDAATKAAVPLIKDKLGDTAGSLAAQAIPSLGRVLTNSLFATPKQSIPDFLDKTDESLDLKAARALTSYPPGLPSINDFEQAIAQELGQSRASNRRTAVARMPRSNRRPRDGLQPILGRMGRRKQRFNRYYQ